MSLIIYSYKNANISVHSNKTIHFSGRAEVGYIHRRPQPGFTITPVKLG